MQTAMEAGEAAEYKDKPLRWRTTERQISEAAELLKGKRDASGFFVAQQVRLSMFNTSNMTNRIYRRLLHTGTKR
jgi:hypothetical protein